MFGIYSTEFDGEICGTLDEALEFDFSSGIFAIRVDTFVVRGDRGALIAEIDWREFAVLVEHELSFDDGVYALESQCVKLSVQVVEDRRDGVGPNLNPSIVFILRGFPRVLVCLDEHTSR